MTRRRLLTVRDSSLLAVVATPSPVADGVDWTANHDDHSIPVEVRNFARAANRNEPRGASTGVIRRGDRVYPPAARHAYCHPEPARVPECGDRVPGHDITGLAPRCSVLRLAGAVLGHGDRGGPGPVFSAGGHRRERDMRAVAMLERQENQLVAQCGVLR